MEFSTIVAADNRSLLPAKLNEVGIKNLIGALFDFKKSRKFEKFSESFNQKTWINETWRAFYILSCKTNNIVFEYTSSFGKIDENLFKN